MPKSPTERINELDRLTVTLLERLDGSRWQVESNGDKLQRTDETLQDVKKAMAVVEERLTELKRVVELNSQRRWAVVPSLVGALMGGALAFAGQLAIRRWLAP